MEQDVNRPKIEDLASLLADAQDLCAEVSAVLREYDFKTARKKVSQLMTRLAPLDDLMKLVEQDLRVEAFDTFTRIRATDNGDARWQILEEFLRKLGGP